ncbi:hypothetical protein ACFE04_009120 [Oxalis oulophora]
MSQSSSFPLSKFNLLLGGVAKSRLYKETIFLYQRLIISTGFVPNFITLHILLNCFSGLGRVSDGFLVLGVLLRKGYDVNIVTFNSLVKGLCAGGRNDEAFKLFEKMSVFGCVPNDVTYGTLIHGFCRSGDFGVALKLHEEIGDNGNGEFSDVSKNQETDDAVSLLRKIICNGIKPTVVTSNTIMSSFFRSGKVSEAQKLLGEMRKHDVVANMETYCMIMDGLCKNVYNPLIDGLCKTGKLKDAWWVFNRLSDRGLVPDVITYSIMIHELCKEGKLDKANDMLFEMEKKGCAPNIIIFNTLMHSFCENNEMQSLVDLLNKMAARNLSPNDFTIYIVVDMLSKVDNYHEYFELIPQFPVRKAIVEHFKKN